MLEPLCVCALVTPLASRTHVICVLHKMEEVKPTNTGHLLAMILQNAQCRVRGERGQALDTHDFEDPARRTLLLFPTEDARVLSSELLAEDPRPVRLIVPDATWKQASRLARKVDALKSAERVVLPPGQVSQYRLRRHARPDALCTYEAVVEALCIIDDPALREPLEQLFRVFVDRTLWSRGELKASEVTGGITTEVAQWKNCSPLGARGAARSARHGADQNEADRP